MASSLNERARQAARIAAAPENYKICEGCDSIVTAGAATCPNCFGYRFDGDRQAVIDQALRLGGREQTTVLAEDLF